MILYSKGEPERQDRKNLQNIKFLEQRPTLAIETGKYTFKDWTVKVAKDKIEFQHSALDDRFTIEVSAAVFVHNGRTIPR